MNSFKIKLITQLHKQMGLLRHDLKVVWFVFETKELTSITLDIDSTVGDFKNLVCKYLELPRSAEIDIKVYQNTRKLDSREFLQNIKDTKKKGQELFCGFSSLLLPPQEIA